MALLKLQQHMQLVSGCPDPESVCPEVTAAAAVATEAAARLYPTVAAVIAIAIVAMEGHRLKTACQIPCDSCVLI